MNTQCWHRNHVFCAIDNKRHHWFAQWLMHNDFDWFLPKNIGIFRSVAFSNRIRVMDEICALENRYFVSFGRQLPSFDYFDSKMQETARVLFQASEAAALLSSASLLRMEFPLQPWLDVYSEIAYFPLIKCWYFKWAHTQYHTQRYQTPQLWKKTTNHNKTQIHRFGSNGEIYLQVRILTSACQRILWKREL